MTEEEKEGAYKMFLLLENRLEQELYKSAKAEEFQKHDFIYYLLNNLRREYKILIK